MVSNRSGELLHHRRERDRSLDRRTQLQVADDILLRAEAIAAVDRQQGLLPEGHDQVLALAISPTCRVVVIAFVCSVMQASWLDPRRATRCLPDRSRGAPARTDGCRR